MILILISIPLAISFLLGFLLLRRILGQEAKTDPLLCFFLAGGLGLGTSSALTFLSFIVFNQFNRVFIIAVHLVVLLGLIFIKPGTFRLNTGMFSLNLKPLSPGNLTIAAILIAALWPLYLYASYYPYGGWDAWSCWNLKARFLYVGQESWQNMFDPVLWRSSPHYPLLLPLIHVWTWSFLPAPLEMAPLINSILITILTAGLLIAGLRAFIPPTISVLSALLFLTMPFYVKLAISQYSDGILGYFLLAAIVCLVIAKLQKHPGWAVLAGVFLGFLSFTKPEGMMASLILILLAFFHFLWKENNRPEAKKLVKNFLVGAAVAFIPTVLFQIGYSPGNQTFINGLTSTDSPADLYRFKFIFAYSYTELTSEKWHFIWWLLALGMILARRESFRKDIVIVPVFLLAYSGVIAAYYFLNTYFKIEWWLQVSLNRILFSLLPVAVFWIFYTLWRERAGKD
jgi:hypothetical protein